MPSEHADVLSQVHKLICLRGDHISHGKVGPTFGVVFQPDWRPRSSARADGHKIRSNLGRNALQLFETAVDTVASSNAQIHR